MDLERTLNLLATVFGAIGSIYVLRSLLQLTPDLTAAIASTYYGYSLPQLESLSRQRAESVVGAVVIVIALLLAVANAGLDLKSHGAFSSRATALTSIFAAGAVVVLACVTATRWLATRHASQAARVLVRDYLDRLLARGGVTVHDIDRLRSYARRLLHIDFPADVESRVIVEGVAHAVGRQVPPAFVL